MFTSSECQGEFLRLDLGDLARVEFVSTVLLAVGHRLVLIDADASTWVLNFGHSTISLLQGFQIITASRLGLTHSEEFL